MKYSVEKIIDRRYNNGQLEYFLKWEGYPSEENSWEPAGNLDCPVYIREFEETRKNKINNSFIIKTLTLQRLRKSVPVSKAVRDALKQTSTHEEILGFDRGLEPEEIIGISMKKGKLYFLMKWKNDPMAELVPAKQAHEKCPQLVIRFYEARIEWE